MARQNTARRGERVPCDTPAPPGINLAADHGSFDLDLAGGLFDYLEERSPEP